MNRPVRRALTAAVAGLVLLAGCSDNPEPAPLEPAASSPSASESADAAPEMPDEARENTPEGAEAFVRHWVEVLNHAAATGQTEPVRALSLSACDPCIAMVEGIDSIYAAGGELEGGEWVVRSTSAVPGPDGRQIVDVDTEIDPQVLRENAKGTPKRYAGGDSFKIFTLSLKDDGWAVEYLEQP